MNEKAERGRTMKEAESRKWTAIGWRLVIWMLLLVWLMLVVTSCELTYYEAAEITININWSQAGLPAEEAAYGATALFYPSGGGKPYIDYWPRKCESICYR